MNDSASEFSQASRESSKVRSSRIPSNYFQNTTKPVFWKYVAAGVAAAVTLVYAAFACLTPGSQAFNHGTLSRAHANLSCADCHGDQLAQPITTNAAWASDATIQATNNRCNDCHFKDGLAAFANGTHHHAVTNAKSSNALSCLDCHREHQGHDVTLAAVTDTACVSCHSNLVEVREGNTDLRPVADFRSHPEFRALPATPPTEDIDPGTLVFNHALHLAPGIYKAGVDSEEKAWRADRTPEIQERFRGDGLLQLACADCHQPTADGEFMKPIVYEQHCSICHPLNINLESDKQVVGHGLPQDEVRSQVYSYFVARESHSGSPLLSQRARFARPGLASERYSTDVWEEKVTENVRDSADRVMNRLYDQSEKANSCYYCHQPDGSNDYKVAFMDTPEKAPRAVIPEVWFELGRFDHAAHSFQDCQECHGGTTESIESATDHERVLIPSIDSCRVCHQPATPRNYSSSANCIKCHDYHTL